MKVALIPCIIHVGLTIIVFLLFLATCIQQNSQYLQRCLFVFVSFMGSHCLVEWPQSFH